MTAQKVLIVPLSCLTKKGAFKQTTRKSHSISGERARSRGLQAMLFEPVVQIGFGGVIAPRDELPRRTVRQQAFDLRPNLVQLVLAGSFRTEIARKRKSPLTGHESGL